MRKIPVFYHIPKNAGTYVSDWMLIAFRHYRRTYTDWLERRIPEKDSIKVIQITKDGFIIARLLVGDSNYFCDEQVHFNRLSNTIFEIDFDKELFDWLNSVFIFGVIIESNGFKNRQHILELLNNYNFYQFLILREPFYRAQSIYNYNMSEESINDYSHNLIKANTFEQYVLSEQIEDSWLIRNLVGINDSTNLEELHYKQALEILKHFNVYDIKHTDEAVQKTFLNCYSFDVQQIKLKEWDIFTKNETKYKKININELTEKAYNTFNLRTVLDQRLYKHFFK